MRHISGDHRQQGLRHQAVFKRYVGSAECNCSITTCNHSPTTILGSFGGGLGSGGSTSAGGGEGEGGGGAGGGVDMSTVPFTSSIFTPLSSSSLANVGDVACATIFSNEDATSAVSPASASTV
jgi:hypothetical protein